MNKRNVVLNFSAGANRGEARMIVDQTHPFFFDHPLDHVPGLLLLEGAVQAAQNCASLPCFVGAVRAEFVKYAYFEHPIHVRMKSHEADGAQTCQVDILQNERLRARVAVDLRPEIGLDRAGEANLGPKAQRSAGSSVGRDAACDGALLNKRRVENVLITTPKVSDDCVTAQLLPMADNCLFGDGFDVVHPLYLLEAFMQVQRFLNATQDGDKRIRDILTGVRIDLSRPLASLAQVSLRGNRAFHSNGSGRLLRSAMLCAAGQAFARCEIETARVMRRALQTSA
jgi:hypothetical protein